MLYDLLKFALARTDVNGALLRFDVQFNKIKCIYSARATYANGKVVDYIQGYNVIVKVVTQ